MANNLRKFATEADYSAATLSYPAVSWVTATDNVHFDKSVQVNEKVMILFGSRDTGDDLVLYNCGDSEAGVIFTSIILNGVEVSNPTETCQLQNASEADTDYLVEYSITNTEIGVAFSGDLGIGSSSNANSISMLIPSKITTIHYLPSNLTDDLIIQATTPPTFNGQTSELNVSAIWVPDEAVNTYKADSTWGEKSADIYPISQYAGELPT